MYNTKWQYYSAFLTKFDENSKHNGRLWYNSIRSINVAAYVFHHPVNHIHGPVFWSLYRSSFALTAFICHYHLTQVIYLRISLSIVLLMCASDIVISSNIIN